MDDDDMAMAINLDLNRRPFLDPSPSSPPAPAPIEDRIRQLEAVTARANQRQRWRRVMNNSELNCMPVMESRNENCKRDISHLAKALEMDLNPKEIENGGDSGGVNGGSFFDCNICLETAKDPILTCCGHLFCWACFYQVPYVDSVSKECPSCKGEVIDSNITPIYGNGKDSDSSSGVSGSESAVKIPPRPRARRVEGVRQQGFFTGVSHIPVGDALRRIRIGLGLVDENSRPPGVIGLIPTPAADLRLLNGSEGGIPMPAANLRLLNGSEGGIPANLRLLNGSEGAILTPVANLLLLNGSEGGVPTPAANLLLLNGSEGGVPTPAANLLLLNGSEGGVPTPAANPRLLNGSEGGIPTPAANLLLLNGSEGGIPTPAANPRLLNGPEGGRFSGMVSERLVEDLETYISVANTASVGIQSEAQLAEMNLSRRNLGTTVLHMGALGNDGSVEIDLTVSRRVSSRRRGVLNLEGHSSLELRRR
ncbi:hypothetical protein OSB04_012957 [Centaurea solstitialis]|uniref:E3 ubiquitin-protein ligase RMA n=1 Tax=Centaurea solstitialis TaxID=347529 RepID=A0AA38TCC9_9ASTR|nr:hypothetical protein OSB04_012957 [Centaurea solstitialis]